MKHLFLISAVLIFFSGEILAQKQCPGITVVGRGYNIFGEYANNKSVKEPLFKLGNSETKPMDDGNQYNIPDLLRLKYVNEKDYKTTEGSSLRQYAQSMSVGLGISVDALFFSGSVQSRFGSEKSGKTSNYFYTITDWTRVWEVSINPFKSDNLRQYLTADAKKAIDTWSPAKVFEVLGTHFVSSGYFGGAMEFNLSESFSSASEAKSISVAVKAQYQAVSANSDVNFSKSEVNENFKSNVKIYARGGDVQYANKSSAGDNNQYNRWVSSIPTKAVLIDFKEGSLVPIWSLAGTQTRKDALKAEFLKLLKKYPLPAGNSSAMMISNSVYFIKDLADNQYIDIPNYHFDADRQRGTKVAIFPKDNREAGLQGIDRFIKAIPHATEPDYVFLQPQHSDLVLDVKGASKNPGTKVHLWNMGNNNAAQMFKLIEVDGKSNTYYIQNKNSKLYITSHGQGKQLTQEKITNAKNQQWKFETARADDMAPMRTNVAFAFKNVAAKRYMDLSGKGKNAKTKDGHIKLWDMDYMPDRYAKLIRSNIDNYYYVQQMHSKYVWDIEGGETNNGAKLQLWDKNNSQAQQFRFIYAGSAMTFRIENKGSKKYIDANGQKIDQNGCPIQIWKGHNNDNQKWKLEPLSEWYAPKNPVKVKIKVAYSNKYWDIAGPDSAAKVKGKKLQIWDMDSGADRYYTIKRSGQNAWIWFELDGGKRIDVKGGKVNVNRTGLQTWDAGNNNKAQKFAIHPTGRYTCIIVSQGWKALDVEGGKINENGTRLILWDQHYGASQQFQLMNAATGKPIDFRR